ncbi:MAG TPA: dihydroneopterin aldolase [Ohtaekwangia sp.]|nr:dihydroneopterin aldolase [Ohtaekwangia sp.]
MIGKIALEGLQFHAFHGVYPHERESGNFFEVDIAVQADFSVAAEQDDINATVNYETIFKIVKDEMDQPSKLLETVAKKIIDHVMEAFPTVDLVELKISKLNPPIGGKCDRSSLTVSVRR